MPRYYIKAEGRKIYRETKAEISKLAREFANATGIGVPVYAETITGGHRAYSAHKNEPFVRNPTSTYPRIKVHDFTTHTGQILRVYFVNTGSSRNHGGAYKTKAEAEKAIKKFNRNPVMQGHDYTGERWLISGIAPQGVKAKAYIDGTRDDAEREADYARTAYRWRGITVRRVEGPVKVGKMKRNPASSRITYKLHDDGAGAGKGMRWWWQVDLDGKPKYKGFSATKPQAMINVKHGMADLKDIVSRGVYI